MFPDLWGTYDKYFMWESTQRTKERSMYTRTLRKHLHVLPVRYPLALTCTILRTILCPAKYCDLRLSRIPSPLRTYTYTKPKINWDINKEKREFIPKEELITTISVLWHPKDMNEVGTLPLPYTKENGTGRSCPHENNFGPLICLPATYINE